MSGGAKNFHLRAITQDVWGTEVPSEVRGKASVGVPQQLNQFADIGYRF